MILSIQINLRIPKVAVSPETAYTTVQQLTSSLSGVHKNFEIWHDSPSSPKDRAIPFSDKPSILDRIQRTIERHNQEFGPSPDGDGAMLLLSTAASEREWQKAGRADLDYSPNNGMASFYLKQPESTYGVDTASIVKKVLENMVRHVSPTFAATDVKSKILNGGYITYRFNRRLYQHREYFGWMGFVPQVLRSEDVSDAHEVIPVGDKGTVIVSVPGVFDPSDGAQVDKVHRVEMQLAHYNLLPVTDQSLLK